MWWSASPGVGRRAPDPGRYTSRPAPTSAGGSGTTTSSRSCGTTASSRSRPIAARRGPPGRARRGRQRGHDGRGPARQPGRFGHLQNGLTSSSGGWRHDWVDLTLFAGQTIQLRLRVATDAAFQERGWFADDFSVTANGATVFSDGVESGLNGWTPQVRSSLARPAAAGSSPAARSCSRTTTWPSGGTSTASTRA